MGMTTAPKILLCAASAAAVEDVRRLLGQEGYTTGWHNLLTEELHEFVACDLIVVDSSRCEHEALELCQRLRTRLADRLLPILG